MKLLFTYYGHTPTLNDVLGKTKQHFGKYAKEKKSHTDMACILAKATGIKLKGRVRLLFVWHRKDARTDPDNVAFAKKYLLDGMVNAGMLVNDGPKQIAGFQDEFFYGEADKVEVFLIESNG